MRPTGKLHLGNYVALCKLGPHAGAVRLFFVIVDWHALTTDYGDTSRLKENLVTCCWIGWPPDSIPRSA